MSQSAVLGFAAVSFAVIVVPGPSVLFAVSRAIVGGRRNALLTVLGNASGLFVQAILVALGLGVLVSGSDAVYAGLQLAGAAYLAWLGLAAIRHRHDAARTLGSSEPAPTVEPWRDGFVVGVTNPKSVVFLAAFLPQYVHLEAGRVPAQMIVLGALFCLIAIICDGAWAVAAARARRWLVSDARRVSAMSCAAGLVMIALGVLLALG